MLNIDLIKDEIVQKLTPLDIDKIILFGSFSRGEETKDSDIDLFLVTDSSRDIEVEAMIRLRELTKKYSVGFDVLSASEKFLRSRDDYFYKIDILKNGKVLLGE